MLGYVPTSCTEMALLFSLFFSLANCCIGLVLGSSRIGGRVRYPPGAYNGL